MLAFTERLSPKSDLAQSTRILALTAEERTRTRHRFDTLEGESIVLCLPRGSVLQDRDVLRSPTGEILQILAKPEPVLTVTADNALTLLRAAYHLGNRHVPLEVASTYLRLSPDSVLQAMLEQLGVAVTAEIAPFNPETGAYRHHH